MKPCKGQGIAPKIITYLIMGKQIKNYFMSGN